MSAAGDLRLFDAGLTGDPHDIGAGWDGAMWFTEPDGDRIGRITPLGQITEFTAPGGPTAITAGFDRAMWFTARKGAVGRIALDGTVTEMTAGLPPGSQPGDIALGADAALWFTLEKGIGRVTTAGAITSYSTPGMRPGAITAGWDGAMWFTDRKHPVLGRISRFEQAAAPVDPPVLARTFVASAKRGRVMARTPGGKHFEPLDARVSLPVGSVVDARHGRVRLRTAVDRAGHTQTGTFYGGRFKVRQPSQAGGIVKIALRGRLHCRASRSLATTSRRRRHRRRVWGIDLGGLFATLGLNSVTTVRGTRWLTEDRCRGTLTKVIEGSVVVRERATGKRFVLHAGERHFARHRP